MTYTKEQVLAIIGEDDKPNTGFLDEAEQIHDEGWVDGRGTLRHEQRQRLENMKPNLIPKANSVAKKKPKKTREVIQYC